MDNSCSADPDSGPGKEEHSKKQCDKVTTWQMEREGQHQHVGQGDDQDASSRFLEERMMLVQI